MSKLVYPNNGIYKYCKDHIEDISENLLKAISNCTLDIPSSFTYKNYLSGLNSILNDYYKEISNINSKLQHSNNNYEKLESDLTSDTKKISINKIKERDRMII